MSATLTLTLALLTASPETPEAAACRWALAELESGCNDLAFGANCEVSRFQILPSEWSRHAMLVPILYLNEVKAWDVALRTLQSRILVYERRPGAKTIFATMSPAAIYALWHRPDRYRRSGYRLSGLTATERERCRRFANLYAKRLAELK